VELSSSLKSFDDLGGFLVARATQYIIRWVEFICTLFPVNLLLSQNMLIPQVRPTNKYPIPPWEMIHPPGGDNAVCR
jgi:hypothetical protein